MQVHLICLPQNQIAFHLKFPFNFLREMDAYSTQGKLLQFSSGFPSCLPSLGEGSQSQGIRDAPGGHQSCILAPSQGMLLCPPKPAFSCRYRTQHLTTRWPPLNVQCSTWGFCPAPPPTRSGRCSELPTSLLAWAFQSRKEQPVSSPFLLVHQPNPVFEGLG